MATNESACERYPHLLRPIRLGDLTLKNRIFSAPTSMSEIGSDTHYTKESIEYYKLRAAGGAAVVCIGEVIVDLENGKSHPLQACINDPTASESFCRLVDAIHSHGAAARADVLCRGRCEKSEKCHAGGARRL